MSPLSPNHVEYNGQCLSRIGSKDSGHGGVILKGGCVLAELRKVMCLAVQYPILAHQDRCSKHLKSKLPKTQSGVETEWQHRTCPVSASPRQMYLLETLRDSHHCIGQRF